MNAKLVSNLENVDSEVIKIKIDLQAKISFCYSKNNYDKFIFNQYTACKPFDKILLIYM